jgi:hypothetical protein
MAVQKNFVVKNGLEVNDNLIFANSHTNRVGIATTTLNYTLDVGGTVGAKNSVVTGVSTVNDLVINGRIAAGSSLGVQGQYLISTGVGVTWGSVGSVRSVDVQSAISGQKVFNTNYTVGLLDVYINGVKLSLDEFAATDSITVTLDDACFGGENVEFITYTSLGVSNTGIQGITVLDEGSIKGSSSQIRTLNFVGSGVTVTGVGNSLTIDVSSTGGGGESYWESTTAGIHTLSNVGIGTTNPTSKLTVDGDVKVGVNTSNGLVLTSPNGTQYRLIVDNSGVLSTVSI